MKTKVTLVDFPRYPIETVAFLWDAARNNDPIKMTVEQMSEARKRDDVYDDAIRETFEKVIDSSIPIAENLNFTFLIEGVSISWREQAVRHKIGMKFGDRLGLDMFPDIHDSTFWIQSMRVLDMGKFAKDDLFRMPDSVANHPDPLVVETYVEHMHQAAQDYAFLLERGVPIEDAREVIPLGAQHRLSWTLNLSAILHICKKRSCWVPQIGTWGPVIEGIVNELAEKVDPYFRKIVTPPCIKGEEFIGCVYKLDNERRIKREDVLLPCPLYLHHHGDGTDQPEAVERARETYTVRFKELELAFGKLWGRDTKTGKLTNV